jgi:hypothetical protein
MKLMVLFMVVLLVVSVVFITACSSENYGKALAGVRGINNSTVSTSRNVIGGGVNNSTRVVS